MSWSRFTDEESVEEPRVWKNQEGSELRVKKFTETETWDTWEDSDLKENFDSKKEAIERAKACMN